MDVSRDEVLKVAALARLELSDDEVDSLRRDLADILSHVAELGDSGFGNRDSGDGLRASNVEHRASSIELRTTNHGLREREGAGGDSLSGGVEGIAPDFRDGFFRVPRLGSHEGTDSDAGTDAGTHRHTHRERR